MQSSTRKRTAVHPLQMDLFSAVIGSYMEGEALTNDALYERLCDAGHLSAEDLKRKGPIGKDGKVYNLTKHRIRWWQNSLKKMGVIERLPDERGTWRLAHRDKNDLTQAPPKVTQLAFSTDLGVAVWGACREVFGGLTESIACCITSPPYPLRQPRAYGNPNEERWVDFVCHSLEPIIERLLPGGTLCVNLTNDAFLQGMPARSHYKELFVLALHRRFGLYKVDELQWVNPNKPPGPIQWASKQRVCLNTGFEPCLVFTLDPKACIADNRRVLQPHSEAQLRLMQQGGEKRARVNCDGAYRIKEGSFGRPTAGRIPRNVLNFSHNCGDQQRMRRAARAAGLPTHGAPMPLALAIFLVQYLSRPGDLVVDPFGGSLTTAKAAELEGRRWMAAELQAEYLMAGRLRFDPAVVSMDMDWAA